MSSSCFCKLSFYSFPDLLSPLGKTFALQSLQLEVSLRPQSVRDLSRSMSACSRVVPDEGLNLLQAAHQRNVGPLLPHEIQVIDEQLRFMGKQPKRWELIINHHLPYRTVGHLSKLWAAHQAVLQQTAPGWPLAGLPGALPCHA